MSKPNTKQNLVQPKCGGAIFQVNQNDVLCGRGGRINNHSGNIQFRNLARKYRNTYLSCHTKKNDKIKIALHVLNILRTMEPPVRFLQEESRGSWVEIGDERAVKKVSQAMREKLYDSNKPRPAARAARKKKEIKKECHKEGKNLLECDIVIPRRSSSPRSIEQLPHSSQNEEVNAFPTLIKEEESPKIKTEKKEDEKYQYLFSGSCYGRERQRKFRMMRFENSTLPPQTTMNAEEKKIDTKDCHRFYYVDKSIEYSELELISAIMTI